MTSHTPGVHDNTETATALIGDAVIHGKSTKAEEARFSFSIHGARGLFALLVLFFHVSNSGLPTWHEPGLISEAFSSLKYGVELFFGISGYVIAGTLERSRTPLRFILNRATRIFPVLWVVVPVYAAILIGPYLLKHGFHDLRRPAEIAVLALANMFALGPLLPVKVLYGVTWTICYEFTFYLLCFAYLQAKTSLKFSILPIVLLAGLWLCAWHPRAIFFLCGVIVARGWLSRPFLDKLARFPFVFLVGFLACWQLAANRESPFFDPVFDWGGSWRPLLAAGAFVSMTLMLQGLSKGYGLLGRFLTTPVMLWLGTISYSLYLWHPMLLGIIKAGMRKLHLVGLAGEASQVLFLALALPAAVLVAAASQWVLERNTTRALRQWIT